MFLIGQCCHRFTTTRLATLAPKSMAFSRVTPHQHDALKYNGYGRLQKKQLQLRPICFSHVILRGFYFPLTRSIFGIHIKFISFFGRIMLSSLLGAQCRKNVLKCTIIHITSLARFSYYRMFMCLLGVCTMMHTSYAAQFLFDTLHIFPEVTDRVSSYKIEVSGPVLYCRK